MNPVLRQQMIPALLVSEVLSVVAPHPFTLIPYYYFTLQFLQQKTTLENSMNWTSEVAVTAKQLMYLYSRGLGFA